MSPARREDKPIDALRVRQRELLCDRTPHRDADDVRLPDAAAWGQLPAGAPLEKGDPLFPRKEVE